MNRRGVAYLFAGLKDARDVAHIIVPKPELDCCRLSREWWAPRRLCEKLSFTEDDYAERLGFGNFVMFSSRKTANTLILS